MGVGKRGRERCGCEDKAVLGKGSQGGAQECEISVVGDLAVVHIFRLTSSFHKSSCVLNLSYQVMH